MKALRAAILTFFILCLSDSLSAQKPSFVESAVVSDTQYLYLKLKKKFWVQGDQAGSVSGRLFDITIDGKRCVSGVGIAFGTTIRDNHTTVRIGIHSDFRRFLDHSSTIKLKYYGKLCDANVCSRWICGSSLPANGRMIWVHNNNAVSEFTTPVENKIPPYTPPDPNPDPDPDPPNDDPAPNPPPSGGGGGGGGGGGNNEDDSEDDDSGSSRPISRCSEPEAGTRVWRWIQDTSGESILQLEASTLGRDDEQKINSVITLFNRKELGDDYMPSVIAGNWLQVERVGERDWPRTIDGKRFYVNHFETRGQSEGDGLHKAQRNITVGESKYPLQRPVSRSILTGCDWKPLWKRDCEAGTLVWRWIRSTDGGGAFLQIESASSGSDGEQMSNSALTLFTLDEFPEDHIPVVRVRNYPRLEILGFDQAEGQVAIEGKDYHVYHIGTGEGRSSPFTPDRPNSLMAARHFITVDDWRFQLQRPVDESVVTGCK